MGEIINPYIAGAPVTETKMFFGLNDVNKLLPTVKKKYWNIMAELIKDFSIEFAFAGVFEIGKFAIGRR